MPDGPARARGITAGAHEASVILAERAGDGLDTASVDIPWTPPPPAPGVFQLTLPVSRPPIRAGEGNARPFLLKRNDQFDSGPPPRLDSLRYHRALAEVVYIGSANSPRNAEQAEVANFWYPALNVAYVQITRVILADTSRPLSWQARFVAAVNVITTDAQISDLQRQVQVPVLAALHRDYHRRLPPRSSLDVVLGSPRSTPSTPAATAARSARCRESSTPSSARARPPPYR